MRTAQYLKEADSEAEVVNISNKEVTYHVATTAGFRPSIITMKPGEIRREKIGYTMPRGSLPSVVERKTKGAVLPITHPKAKAYLERKTAK